VGRYDRFSQRERIADKAAGLIGFLDDEAGALNAFVENGLLGIRERQGLFILLAEIDDGHRGLDGRLSGKFGSGGSSRGSRRRLIASRRRRLRRFGRSG